MMMQSIRKGTQFIGYEYTDVTIDRGMQQMCIDGYENFGWALDGTDWPDTPSPHTVKLKFKRDRKLRNRAELTRLQRQFDACVSEVQTLEKSKTTGASVVAYTVGLVGSVFMGGAVFAFLASMIPLMIGLAIPAFAGWAAAYLCYKSIRKNRSEKTEPMIEHKRDEIYDVCEKASMLLARG